MTPSRRRNLDRLLRPRHIALIGGRDAVVVAGECQRIGFSGPVWPVNPKREEIGGHRCFATIEDLPEAPDAVFLAVPREAAIEATDKLRAMGAGGIVCYAAGFGELGPGEGREAEERLVAAAGDMALVGPNCYGIINFVDRVALWPFARGGSCPGYGAAIVTQSGMLSSDLTMSQRSLPFAYMISAGNQASLHLEDYLDALVDQDEVRAIGLHIEGLKDVSVFADAALKALRAGKPVVALKTGTSSIGARLTESHTGSLAGSDALYDALFDRLGVVRVATPSQLIETLKFAVVAGVPRGPRVGGFTCSGGGATMLADLAEFHDLQFPAPKEATRAALRKLLPPIATVSNPLDYTTPIWGDPERLPPVLSTFLTDGYDSAVIIQDYPLPGIDESKPYYRNDTLSFATAAKQAGIPAAVCSTLPENLDQETRDFLVPLGVAPMQGIGETVEALGGLVRAGQLMDRLASAPGAVEGLRLSGRGARGAGLARPVSEWDGKVRLRQMGIAVPDGQLVAVAEAGAAASALGYPVALKLAQPFLAHKTEAGAVKLGLAASAHVEAEVSAMLAHVAARYPELDWRNPLLLVERMAPTPVVEMLVGLRNDPLFGPSMTLASGGILAELLEDAVTILLPADRSALARAIDRLKLARLLGGYRGQTSGDKGALIDSLERLAQHFMAADDLIEIEINPLFVLTDGVMAIDALMTVAK
ncbi:MAG: acetate--CoA ligase family protein [Hyphomicrobiaceae bacterium]